MRASLLRIGNSQGIIIPKPIIAQIGLENDVDMNVEDDAIVIRKLKRHVRQGWSDASRALAAAGDDALVWPEFVNEEDRDLKW
jgi:antitoxin MazE